MMKQDLRKIFLTEGDKQTEFKYTYQSQWSRDEDYPRFPQRWKYGDKGEYYETNRLDRLSDLAPRNLQYFDIELHPYIFILRKNKEAIRRNGRSQWSGRVKKNTFSLEHYIKKNVWRENVSVDKYGIHFLMELPIPAQYWGFQLWFSKSGKLLGLGLGSGQEGPKYIFPDDAPLMQDFCRTNCRYSWGHGHDEKDNPLFIPRAEFIRKASERLSWYGYNIPLK